MPLLESVLVYILNRFSKFYPVLEKFSPLMSFFKVITFVLSLVDSSSIGTGNNDFLFASEVFNIWNLSVKIVCLFATLFYDTLAKCISYFGFSSSRCIEYHPGNNSNCGLCGEPAYNGIKSCQHVFCYYCLSLYIGRHGSYHCDTCNVDISTLKSI